MRVIKPCAKQMVPLHSLPALSTPVPFKGRPRRAVPTRGTSNERSCASNSACLVSNDQGPGSGGGAGGRRGRDRWWNSDSDGPSRSLRWSLIWLLWACCPAKAYAFGRRKPSKPKSSSWWEDPSVDKYATQWSDLAWPVLQNLGFSGLVGIVCAIAFKAVGRFVAIGLGCTFAVVQLLAYGGFVTVQWSKIHEDILRICDVDQDGQFGAADLHDLVGSFLAVLSQGLPSLSGFCLGFGLGLRF